MVTWKQGVQAILEPYSLAKAKPRIMICMLQSEDCPWVFQPTDMDMQCIHGRMMINHGRVLSAPLLCKPTLT